MRREHDLTGQALVRGGLGGCVGEDQVVLAETEQEVVAVRFDGPPSALQVFADLAQPQLVDPPEPEVWWDGGE